MCWLRVDAEQLHIITGVSSRGGGGGRVGCGAGACREALNNRRNEASAWMRLRVIALLMTRILTLPPPLPKIQGERNWEREKEERPLPQHQEQQRDELAKRLREHSALVWKVQLLSFFLNVSTLLSIQTIADRVAQHLEMISKNFQFSTRRTRILMGFIIIYLVLIVNPMGRILVRWTSFTNNLETLCHPICNWLYYIYSSLLNFLCLQIAD